MSASLLAKQGRLALQLDLHRLKGVEKHMNFVFDLDGTICFSGRPITKKIVKALGSLEARGHTIIFASARPIRDMLPVIDKRFHTYTMIGGNGSLLFQNGELIHASAFTALQITQLKSLVCEFEATYLADGEWNYTYTGPQNHPILQNVDTSNLAEMVHIDAHDSIVKLLIVTANSMEILAEEVEKLDVVTHRHRHEDILDISPKNVDKWRALQKLGIKKGEYIAFGNDTNDMTMFEHASHSIMIGDHKELSNYATESIPLYENTEEQLIEKLNQLADYFDSINRESV